MEYYTLLSGATVMIALMTIFLYRRTRDLSVVVSSAVLYYWSLYGAWFIVVDKSGGYSGKHYQYLESKLFPLSLDRDYLITLVLYTLFILSAQVTLLALLKPGKPGRPFEQIVFRHGPILVTAAVAAVASLWLMKDELGAAWALNISAYVYTRGETDHFFTLHQILNRAALIPSAIGLAVLCAGRQSRYFVSLHSRYHRPLYVLLLAGFCVFTFILGNKNEVLVALLCGTLAYLNFSRNPKYAGVVLCFSLGMWFLYATDFFRGVPLSQLTTAVSERLDQATGVGTFMTSSNEAYAAHFSMYGVLSREIPPKVGYSLFSLACSLIPRALWPDRPRDIYLYYSESVGAIQNQGYSIHHATGWYLNFGYLGVPLGGILLGMIWAFCYNARRRVSSRSSVPWRLFAMLAPVLFASELAPVIRAGPEAYKAFLLEGILVPVLTLSLASRVWHVARYIYQPRPAAARLPVTG